jgi:uncharacterized protein
MSPEEALVRSLYEDYAAGDAPAFLAKLDDEIVWICHGPALAPYCGHFEGKAAALAFFQAFDAAVEPLLFRADGVIAQAGQVAAFGPRRARVRATGKIFETRWMHLWTVRNGKAIAHEELQDTAAMAQAFA